MSSATRAWRAGGGAALLAATLMVHAPLDADFSYDDNEFVVANQSIRSIGGAVVALARPFPPEQPERGLYRPLTNLSYAFDHALWGSEALGFHAVNVALYAVVVLLVERLAWTYLGSAGFAFAVALLFAMHPVHCEAVDSVSGRSEILALLFSLTSLLFFLRATRGEASRLGALLGSAAAYALACASKETGVLLPAVLAVHAWSLAPPRPGSGPRVWLRGLRPLAAHGAVLVTYLLLRGSVLGRFAPAEGVLRESDLVGRLATIGTVFLVDLRLLIWPDLEVDFFYQAMVGRPEALDAVALVGWVAIATMGVGALRLARRHFAASGPEVDRERAAWLCAASIFAVTLLPTSHVVDFGALLAERFLFAPSLGFVLLVALGGRRLLAHLPAALRPRAATAVLVAVLAGAGAWRSHARAAEWRDPALLWSAAARSLPGDKRVHTNLAAVLIERGELTAARAAIGRALALDPDYRSALGNLGAVQLEEGKLDEAAATWGHLLELEPDDFMTWYNVGRLELQRGNAELAARNFQRSLDLNPNFSHARLGLDRARAARTQEPR